MFSKYPYANLTDLNLDYILSELKRAVEKVDTFVNVNAIKYANPLTWSIINQYEANTVTLNTDGTAFLSVKPVPAGVSIANTEYWTKIADFSVGVDFVQRAITTNDEYGSPVASANRKIADLVWLNKELYEVKQDIAVGEAYVVGANVIKVTLQEVTRAIYKEDLETLYVHGSLASGDIGRAGDVHYYTAASEQIAIEKE